jgi:hypothetical protein
MQSWHEFVAIAQAGERRGYRQQRVAGRAWLGRACLDVANDPDQLLGDTRRRAGRQRLDHQCAVEIE